MKVKVIKVFKDKACRLKTRQIGDIIDVSDERYEQLINSSLGVFVEVVLQETPINLDEMNKTELIEYAGDKNVKIDMEMTKKQMIKELKL